MLRCRATMQAAAWGPTRAAKRAAKRAGLLLSVVLALAFAGGGALRAQQLGVPQAVVLTISSDRLFAESAFGRRVAAELEAESKALAAENRRKEAELAAEEKALTEKRATMEPAAFRELADAFDRKVQQIRRAQEAKLREIGRKGEQARLEFFNAARPILENLMREAGATAIFERANIFLSSSDGDITDVAIARIDAAIGDGRRGDDSGR